MWAVLEGPCPTNPTEALSGGSTGWQDGGGSLAFHCFPSYGILCLSFPICKNKHKVVWTLRLQRSPSDLAPSL